MKITICTSMAFIDEMVEIKSKLEKLGHEVKHPPVEFVDASGKQWDARNYYKFKKTRPFNDKTFLTNHSERISSHFKKIEWADAILVTNYNKNGIKNYIGPNTLIEMGLAFYLKKPVYLLNPIPDTDWKEEVIGLSPIVINNNLELIA